MYTPPAPGSKIIVIGGGLFGLSTAYALSLKKYDAWVFDRNPVPSPDASSTDINKAVRMDYGGDTLSMQLMMEAYPYWYQWNKERAEMGLSPVFNKTGCLLLTKGLLSNYEILSMKHIREAGYGHTIREFPTPESIVERFPMFKEAVTNGYNKGYFNTDGGWCNSTETIKHLHEKCVDSGVHFVFGPDKGSFEKFIFNGKTVTGIKTRDQQVHLGDHVILATGSWTAGLLDFGNRLQATGQAVIQFTPPPELVKKFKGMPVWCGDISRTGFYGFPINGDGKMKFASHSVGYISPRENDSVSVPRTQVTNQGDTIPIKALERFRTFLAEFFPDTSKLDITYSRVCWYSDTTDGKFLIAPHPGYDNLIIASGDSGHAMKFAPNIGFKIAQILEGIESDYSRAWAWRDAGDASTSSDGARDINAKPLRMDIDPEARMATKDDLKAKH